MSLLGRMRIALTALGFTFTVAQVVLMEGEAGRAAGKLYGVDLVRGCLGALLGAVLFMPVLGIPQACIAVVLIRLAGLLTLA